MNFYRPESDPPATLARSDPPATLARSGCGRGCGRDCAIAGSAAPKTMPWKCLHCGHKWNDRADGKGVQARGCPKCGSHRMFDVNVELVGVFRER